MNEPLTLKVNKTEEKMIEIINKSNLPAFVLKIIIEKIYNEIFEIEQQEIEKYNQECQKALKDKESDK